MSWGSLPTCQVLSGCRFTLLLPPRRQWQQLPSVLSVCLTRPEASRGNNRSHVLTCPPRSSPPPHQSCSRQCHTNGGASKLTHTALQRHRSAGLRIPNTNRTGALNSPKSLPTAKLRKSFSATTISKRTRITAFFVAQPLAAFPACCLCANHNENS